MKLRILISCIAICVSACSFGGQRRPPPPKPTLPPHSEIGSITVAQSTVDEILTVDEISLPNCNGSSELTVRRTLSQSINREIELGNLKMGFSVEVAVLNVRVAAASNVEQESLGKPIEETFEVEIKAAPGTTVTYQIEWLKVSQLGVGELINNDDVYFHEFKIPSSLKARIREPIQTACEASTSTPAQ